MEKLVVVTSVDLLVNESTNQSFYKATFRPVKYLESGKEVFIGDSCTRLYNEGKEPQVGDLFEGKITTFDCVPFAGKNGQITKTHVVSIGEESPLEIANKGLKRNRSSVILNGKPTVVFETVKVDPVVVDSPEDVDAIK